MEDSEQPHYGSDCAVGHTGKNLSEVLLGGGTYMFKLEVYHNNENCV